MENEHIYDVVIIGGSAAATAAGIYAARRKLDFIIISKDFGGEVATSGEIGNWPGIPETDGLKLSADFKNHLAHYGVKPHTGVEVEKVHKQDDGLFCITAKTNKSVTKASEKVDEHPNGAPKCDYLARAVIVTTGVHPRELGIPGEKEFRNKGVSYCTTCDGPLFEGRTVATIGGGNSALESALMLSDIASKVYLVNKNPQFKGETVLIDKVMSKENIEVIYGAMTEKFEGEAMLKKLMYKDAEGNEKAIDVDGAFVHIGQVPNSYVVPDEVKKNQFGEILVNNHCETNIPGLYAAGDVTDVPFKQIVIAAGQGTTALLSAITYLNRAAH